MFTNTYNFARGKNAARAALMIAALASAYPALAQRAGGAISARTTSEQGTGVATGVPGATANTSGGANATTGGLGATSGTVGEASGINQAPALSPSQTPQATVSSPAEATGSTSIGQSGVSPSYAAAPNGNFSAPSFNGGAQGNQTGSVGSGNFTPPPTANSLSGTANQNSGFTTTTGGYVNNTNPLNSGTGTVGATNTTGTGTNSTVNGSIATQGVSPSQGAAPTQGPSPTF
jgi:hypothetical protein